MAELMGSEMASRTRLYDMSRLFKKASAASGSWCVANRPPWRRNTTSAYARRLMFRDEMRSWAAASTPCLSASPSAPRVASSTSRGPPTPNGSSVGKVFAKNEASNESAKSSPRET
ncbi:hypothetical protein FOTG_16743 [Fusarium oxysporum f. sp. vasinfectum 25433]|uniref:Uncharacterized protein n=1 Tax=Fusarium oxysporum f. sp. vasinfectum 25433 TaxID=1089449 RepID=X0M2I1_FUSOX|nr:hypothetical protein FOTG_16743 [Fusarium oxysporum f. sp. vasinfectum 25433]